MGIYAISDLHLCLSDEKKNMNVFPGWDDYVNKLEKNWREKITPEDTVVIAGDISWAMRLEDSVKDFEFLNNLPGRKIILKGNHDYWWSTVNKITNFLNTNNFNTINLLHNCAYEIENYCICGTRGWMYRPETEQDKKIFAREVGRLARSLDIAIEKKLEPIVFLHYPPVYGRDESKEIIDILIEKQVNKCYYGHIHGNRSSRRVIEGEYKNINLKLISCDYLNFCPIQIS
ncbi:MAG: metallophosphoesterase [Clostridia bacterium]|nr:metallophosphoesterase [Clostridia bacterium]